LFTKYQASIPSSLTVSPKATKTREAVARIDVAPPLSVNKSLINKKGTRAFFGDKENNSIIVVDVEKMEHIREISTGHLMTYTTDKIGNDLKAYTVNRGSNAIDVVDTRNMKITKTIKLEHTLETISRYLLYLPHLIICAHDLSSSHTHEYYICIVHSPLVASYGMQSNHHSQRILPVGYCLE